MDLLAALGFDRTERDDIEAAMKAVGEEIEEFAFESMVYRADTILYGG